MDNEYNNGRDFQSQDLKEGSDKNKIWYWVIGLLLVVVLGWWGASAGWFGGGADKDPVVIEDTFAPSTDVQDISLDFANQENLAPVATLRVDTLESFPVQKNLVVSGNLANGCTFLDSINQQRSGNNFYVKIATRTEGEVCTQSLVPYEQTIPLEVIGLPAGVYTVNVNGTETQFELEGDNVIDFAAGSDK